MSINYTLVSIIMLFVILISIQFTLNKIFMILKEIRDILLNKKIKVSVYQIKNMNYNSKLGGNMGKTAFIFPGQGAQYFGMGKDFFDKYEDSKKYIR